MSFKKLTDWTKALLRDFRQVSGQLEDDEWEEAHRMLMGFEKELWASKGGSGAHGSWRPRKDPSRPGSLMSVTGRLKRSLTVPYHPNQIFEVSGDKIKFGTNVPYAQFHQQGGARLPQRRVIDLTEEQIDQLAEAVADKIFEPLT